ncbi:unnamed protein product [Onchocerca flexuosa]|uniref:Uncharacterized protein n=1 Tax=Onchocerca flexuosa TaxID=387005 RepID=A0A183GZJ2_9BILA|nr:unnamed protein product [Onchocerca flexuosa]
MIRNKRSRSYRSGKTDIANAFQEKRQINSVHDTISGKAAPTTVLIETTFLILSISPKKLLLKTLLQEFHQDMTLIKSTLLANAIFEQQEEHNEKVEETGKPKNHLIRKT